MVRPSLDNPAYYINRELSWLAFNERVMEEAEDSRNPLLERVKFLSIAARNLDEFFEVRVADLLQQIDEGYRGTGPDGFPLPEIREAISRKTHAFVDAQYRCWNEQLRPSLAENDIRLLGISELNPRARDFVEEYCKGDLDLLLAPITVDPARPFPQVINKTLCVCFLLRRHQFPSMTYTGVVMAPKILPRLVRLPSEKTVDFILLADLIVHHAPRMFDGYDIASFAPFRVARDSNLYLTEKDSDNLLESVRTELHNRRKGRVVRLEIASEADPEIIERLRTNFELEPWQVFPVKGPALSCLSAIYEQTAHPELKFKPFVPRHLRLTSDARDIFEELRCHDVLLHHPFDSYEAVVSFIESAAEDPRVLSMKQTLYRTSEHPRMIPALKSAAARKEVTVVIELRARFDEASNIRWAQDLEDSGVHVCYGLVGRKTHCKLSLMVRHDPDGVTRQYAHLGTGNYNLTTSRLYTDLSLLTADPKMTNAIHNVFTSLTTAAKHPPYDPLLVAPIDLAERCLTLIAREAEHARRGRPAYIIAKMNALLDKNIIMSLYQASQAGVKIDLIVRGMCALRPGVCGVSDHIRVRSVVGRFLEHSRIYWFANGGEEDVYLGSADWMPRNLYERVEVLFPIKDKLLRERVGKEILESYLMDNVKARLLQTDGSYLPAWQVHGRRTHPATPAAFNAQEFLMALMEGKESLSAIAGGRRHLSK